MSVILDDMKDDAVRRRVTRRAVRDLLADDYAISVYDGEKYTVTKSTDPHEINRALMTADEDCLVVYKRGAKPSFVYFVYDNAPWKVIYDYDISLEDVLKGAQEVSNKLRAQSRPQLH